MKLFVSFNFFSIMLDLASLTDARGESVLYRIKSLFINFGGAWSKQELFKGCSLWTGVNTFTFAGAEIEGGWGFHCWTTNINNEAIKPLLVRKFDEDGMAPFDERNNMMIIFPRCILVVTAIAIFPLAAFTKAIVVPSLPVSQYADTEVTTNIAFNTSRTDVKTFELNFQLECSSSNCIQVALGRDIDSDGILSFAETDVVYGWRNGRYFVEDVKGAFRYEENTSSFERGAHNFAISIQTSKEYQPRMFSAMADSTLLFASLARTVPAWLYRPEWNLMRITRRGVCFPSQSVSYDVKYAQLYIIVR